MAPNYSANDSHSTPPIKSTAVAIDKDKNSPYAVRWAIDHLMIISNPLITLIHVRPKTNHLNRRVYAEGANDANNSAESENNSLFIPYRGYCARKGVQLKEVVLEEYDAPKAILDYIHKNFINRKILSARTALRPMANTATPPKQFSSGGLPPTPEQNGEETRSVRGWRSAGPGYERFYLEKSSDASRTSRERSRNSPKNLSLENIEITNRGARSSFGQDSVRDESDLSGVLMFGSVDISGQNLDFSIAASSPKEQSTKHSAAKELHQWKVEEARKFEEAKNAEEAALAVAEMEKAKCKAAIEAAEAAQRLAEKESQRRKLAEIKARREAEEKNRALSALAQNDIRYRKYTIDEIEAATDKFSESMKIGEGGYGPVYKGKLDHTPVAIKVEVLSCIRHPNMVLLLGACPEYGCLIYEYMNNGSLEDRLFRRGHTTPISWRRRFKIAAEIATALLFLHQAKPEPLVHRDLKPANILLDRNFVSKISDVGLARLVPPSVANSVTQYHMTSAAGTFCYIDPEYQQTGMLTTKSDIYSFGIMLLQIITAKPPMGLAHHVQKAIEKGTFEELLDPTVPDWPVDDALEFAKLALKCAELRKKDRPDLAAIILPELNRLRDLGRNCEIYSSNSSQNHSHLPRHPTTISHSRTTANQ
ncbi:u-box domain-containing protein 52, partial [Quercus suber]